MRSDRGSSAPVVHVVVSLLALAACEHGGRTLSPAAPDFTLACTFTPTTGLAPLGVSLVVVPTTVDVQARVQWGDGVASTELAHVYTQPGTYAATASAVRDGRNATCSANVTVQAPPPKPPGSAPAVQFKVNPSPAVGPAPLEVGFNMCGSVDPDGDPLFFSYDFGDGARSGSTFCRRQHTYARGRYTALICATDGDPGHEICGAFDVLAQ